MKPIRDRLQSTKRDLESCGRVVQEYAMASGVLITALGMEWWEKHFNVTSRKRDPFVQVNNESSEGEMLEHQHRVINLGDRLYSLRDCDGFDDFVGALRTRDLESTYFELEVAH